MLINGTEQSIIAEPLSSSPLMSVEIVTAKGVITKEIIGNTLITYIKSESEKIQGLVVGWNEIITDDGNIILNIGSNIQIDTGEIGSLIKRFEGDILYTAEDIRELNSIRFPSGFALKGLESEKIVTPNHNELSISPCSGMIDGIMFRLKKPEIVTIETGTNYFRVDSVVVKYDSEKNRVYLKVNKGEETTEEKAKAPDLIQQHLGTYEIKICDVKVRDFMANLREEDIIDRRDLIRPDTAKDILFDDEYIIIPNDKEKTVHNALIKLHENTLEEIDNRKAEDEKIVLSVDVEREERIADDKTTNERIDNLKAEDISYYNTGLMPDDETNTVEPNVQGAMDALYTTVKNSLDNMDDRYSKLENNIENEKDEREASDTLITDRIARIENYAVRMDLIEAKNSKLENDIKNEQGIRENTDDIIFNDINQLNISFKNLETRITKVEADIKRLEGSTKAKFDEIDSMFELLFP